MFRACIYFIVLATDNGLRFVITGRTAGRRLDGHVSDLRRHCGSHRNHRPGLCGPGRIQQHLERCQ